MTSLENNTLAYIVVLCDTRDTSILIADTYVTIPVSPNSRYTAVYRSSKKYRETAQVSRVSTIPRVSFHWATSSLQAYDAKTNVIVTHIEALRKQQSLSQQESRAAARKPRQVVVHAPASCGRGLEGDGRSILEVMRRRRRRHAKSSENVLSDYSWNIYTGKCLLTTLLYYTCFRNRFHCSTPASRQASRR